MVLIDNQSWKKRHYNQCHGNNTDHKGLFELLHTSKLDSLEEMNKLLEIFHLSRLNYEELGNLDKPITIKEIKNLPK